jgi:hypothetical protein
MRAHRRTSAASSTPIQRGGRAAIRTPASSRHVLDDQHRVVVDAVANLDDELDFSPVVVPAGMRKHCVAMRWKAAAMSRL